MPGTSSASVRIFSPPFGRETLVAHLRRRVEDLCTVLPVTRVVLFGSYARKRHTIASGIDLLVIYAGAKRDSAYALVRRTLDVLRLEPHIYSEEERRLLQRTSVRTIADSLPLFPADAVGG